LQVEGGTEETIEEADIIEDLSAEALAKVDDKDVAVDASDSDSQGDSDSSGSDEGSGSGWWRNSPVEHQLERRVESRADHKGNSERIKSEQSSGNHLTEANDDDDDGIDLSRALGTSARDSHSQSTLNLLEHESSHGLSTPLLHGFGFQDMMYEGLFQTALNKSVKEESTSGGEDDEDPWEQASVKVDGVKGKAILYIQMEYCATTLRKLIDDGAIGKMEENEVWRMVRQTLEALLYIHSRNIIHRDLKPGKFYTATTTI
jgi:serine/threonine protein kinase